MARKIDPRDLSVNELRRLLMEKQRSGRNERIERYRETGRVVRLVSDDEDSSWEDLRTSSPTGEGPLDPLEESKTRKKKSSRRFFTKYRNSSCTRPGVRFIQWTGYPPGT